MPTYHTVFDVAATSTAPWRLGLAFIICAIALLVWRRLLRGRSGAIRHWIIRAGVLIVAALAVVAATYEPAARGELRQALDHGTYQTVEGQIIDYTPGDPAHHVPEHFTVQAKDASHFTFILRSNTPGFHELHASGSPLQKGECVRLAVVGGAIGRVEIADHC